MAVIQSKIYKNEPKNFSNRRGRGRPARRSFIRLCSDPKNSTAPGPRPAILKFLDPPLSASVNNLLRQMLTIAKSGNKIKLFNV